LIAASNACRTSGFTSSYGWLPARLALMMKSSNTTPGLVGTTKWAALSVATEVV